MTEKEKQVYNQAIQDAIHTVTKYIDHAYRKADHKHTESITSWLVGAKGGIQQLTKK